MRIVTYLDRPLEDVVAGFERADVDEVVRDAVDGVLGAGTVVLQVGRPVWLTRRSVVVPVRWGGRGAVVQVVVVQSGATPKTEVIVTVDRTGVDVASAQVALDVVADRLAA